MDDPNHRPDDDNTRCRRRIRDALIRRGLVSAHAETLAKGLVDLVSVIGIEACAEAFAIALGPAGTNAASAEATAELQAAGSALAAVPDAERVLSAFMTELRRLDEALQQLTSQLGRLRKAAPDPAASGNEPKKTLH